MSSAPVAYLFKIDAYAIHDVQGENVSAYEETEELAVQDLEVDADDAPDACAVLARVVENMPTILSLLSQRAEICAREDRGEHVLDELGDIDEELASILT